MLNAFPVGYFRVALKKQLLFTEKEKYLPIRDLCLPLSDVPYISCTQRWRSVIRNCKRRQSEIKKKDARHFIYLLFLVWKYWETYIQIFNFEKAHYSVSASRVHWIIPFSNILMLLYFNFVEINLNKANENYFECICS